MTVKEQNDIANKIMKLDQSQTILYSNSQDFIDIIDSIPFKERTDNLKNAIIHLMEVEKDEEGYYLDAFDKRITYNGIKTLKREGSKTKWTALQKSEYKKCAADFEYFFYGYCKIMTKKGYNFPEVREYQKRMIKGLINFDRLLLSISRQMGKTILVASYILWKSMFGRNTTHGIAAQLTGTATEVLDKLKEIMFGLPFCFLPGTKVFNKGTVSFDNGVRILCSTANGNAFRGFSIVGEVIENMDIPSGAILYIDEAAYISNTDINDFNDSVLPTVESVPGSQIIKSSTAKGRNHWYFEVEGAQKNNFYYKADDLIEEINMTASEAYEENYSDEKNIIKISKRDKGYIVTKHLGKSGFKIVEANYLDKFPNDPKGAEEYKKKIVAQKSYVFFQQTQANEFLGSSKTLIDDKVLANIEVMDDEEVIHNSLFDGLRIYEEPKPGHHYIVTSDPKKDGIDAVGIQVIDVTNIPFNQVATAKIMESYMTVPGRLFVLGNYYNEAMVVCENNVAESIPTTLYYNYDYEGEVFTEKGKKGKKKVEMGFRTTVKTKRLALTMMKNFIENENIKINDKETLEQLFSFIEKKNGTFSAEGEEHDDLVMSLMLAWAPFLDFKNWDNFQGFQDLLEKKKEEAEAEEIEMAEFLDLGFGPNDNKDTVPFTEGLWGNQGISAMDLYNHDING